MAPRSSWPTTWKAFLPISIPTTAIAALSTFDMACSLSFGAPSQLKTLAGQEHGRTIPLSDMRCLFDHLVGAAEQRNCPVKPSACAGPADPVPAGTIYLSTFGSSFFAAAMSALLPALSPLRCLARPRA